MRIQIQKDSNKRVREAGGSGGLGVLSASPMILKAVLHFDIMLMSHAE